MPLGRGVVGLELLAPRPGPIAVDVALGSSTARLSVGSSPLDVALPVPPELASAGHGSLVVRSQTFVPGGADQRRLGVAIARVWFTPG
jgi:hypothetical protein